MSPVCTRALKSTLRLIGLTIALAMLSGCGSAAGTPAAVSSVPSAVSVHSPSPAAPSPERSAGTSATPAPTSYPEPAKAEKPKDFVIVGECTTTVTARLGETRFVIITTCEEINGLLLYPGKTLSLLAVWKTILSRNAGYQASQVLGPGLQPPGMSQFAGTLYNAALLSGLEAAERSNNLLPVRYLPAGLDAAVDSKSGMGFTLRNCLDSPVWLQAALDQKTGALTIQVYGVPWEKEKPIELKSFTETIKAPPGYVSANSKTLKKDQHIVIPARDGVRARVVRVWQNLASGKTRVEELYTDVYAPVPEIVIYPEAEK